MKKSWTVRCGYTARFADTVTVEAETFDEALEKAVETAGPDEERRPTGRRRIFVDAVCEGVHTDPGDPDAACPVPERFTERGEPRVLTLTDPCLPGAGAIEVSGGRVLLRFQTPDATRRRSLSGRSTSVLHIKENATDGTRHTGATRKAAR